MAAPPTPPGCVSAGSRSRWPILLSVVATLGFVLITAALLYDLRQSVEARGRENAQNLLRLIENDVARNLEILDLSLQALAEGVGRPEVMSADPELRQLILFDRSAFASGLGALLAYDAEGRVVVDSSSTEPRAIAPATDREYFQAQREVDRGLFISKPYMSRVVHRPVIGLSRRISGLDGSFKGVALASIEVSYLSNLFQRLQLGRSSTVVLWRNDGAVLLRQNGPVPTVGGLDISAFPNFGRFERQGSGVFKVSSPIDGEERLLAFTRIGGGPLFVSVGLSTASLFAEWWEKATVLLVLAAVISSLLIALTVRLTRELGRRTAAERDLERLNAELARLSATDALTDLGNRRAFDAAITREADRAKRMDLPLALLLVDVDHFKRFNDRYGHLEGDRVLRDVATALRAVCRQDGAGVFRVGGEEFALLLPGSDLRVAGQVSEQLRARLRALGRRHEGSPLGIVTVSVGATDIGDEDPSTAYARADAALYRSKQAGRDRATTAPADQLAA